MKRRTMLAMLALAIMTTTTAICQLPDPPNVPRYINYQGKLTDLLGNPKVGTYNVMFSILDEAGAEQWSETHTVTLEALDNGLFNVLLGTNTPLDLEHFPLDQDDPVGEVTRWLKVTVDGAELSPTKEFVSVPYAFKASDADTLDGLHASEIGIYNGQGPIVITGTNVSLNYLGDDFDLTNSTLFVRDKWVDVTGDTMTGDLTMGAGTEINGTEIISSEEITDLTIMDKDIATNANISASKINVSEIDHGLLDHLTDGDHHTQYSGAGWDETTTLASLDTHVSNLWGTIGFIVGQTGREPYSSVQAAINAAVDAGFGRTNPVTIEVKPGTYTEDLTFKAGIHVKAEIEDGLFSSIIIGNHGYEYNEAGLGLLFLSGIQFKSPAAGGTVPTFSISGSGFTSIRMNHCVLTSSDNGPALELSNTGTQSGRLTNTEMFHCRIRNLLTDFSGPALVDLKAGSLLMKGADVSLSDPEEKSFLASGTSQLIIDNAEIEGQIETTGGAATLRITQSSIDSGALACIVHNGGTGIALEVLFITILPGDVVTGSGIFFYNSVSYFYSAYGIDQTLAASLSYWTGALPIGSENAFNVIYRAAAESYWTGLFGYVPLNLNVALDFLVSGTATQQVQIDALEASVITAAQDPLIVSNGTIILDYDTNDFELAGQIRMRPERFVKKVGDTMTGDLIMSGTAVIQGTGIIDSEEITDGTIVNDDISDAANITGTKVAAATEAARGTVELATSTETAAGLAVQASDTRLNNSRAPTGNAGGDLTGTYPDPGIASGVIVNDDISTTANITGTPIKPQ